MDFIKLQKMKKIISNNETKVACVGTKLCEINDLEDIVSTMSNKYQSKEFTQNDIKEIANYIMKKYNHKTINSKMIVNSFFEAINSPNTDISKADIKTSSIL